MIDFICGEVVSVGEDSVVIQNNGIGYFLSVPANSLGGISKGSKAQFFTYLHIKQDGIALYGFLSESQRAMFEKLITVSGVGPKLAVTILGGMGVNELAMAIVAQDTNTLTSVKGLGKKTAERIILELGEKLTKTISLPAKNEQSLKADAIMLLKDLGISQSDAANRVQNAISSGATTIEQILEHSLKNN
jgi:Holliday junction DNA helicase RuvA